MSGKLGRTLFRLRWKLLGDHVHVRVFAGKGTLTLAKCGDLVFRKNEWDDYLYNIKLAHVGGDVEVMEDE